MERGSEKPLDIEMPHYNREEVIERFDYQFTNHEQRNQ
jgi:hypothetical protein